MAHKQLQGANLRKTINEYLGYCENIKGFSPKTIRSKNELLKNLIRVFDNRPYTLGNVITFRDYMYRTWKKPNSRYDLTTMIRSFTKWLFEKGYIPEDFSKKLEKPKISTRVNFDYLEPEIIDNIIDAGTEPSDPGIRGDNERNRFIKDETCKALKFIIRTGIRIGEAISLKGKDLNLYDNPPSFQVISKGSKDGEKDLLPIPKDMLDILRTRVENDRLFQITPETCNLVLKRGIVKLGIKASVTCHSLRHIFATSLTKQNVPIQMISRLLRHNDVRTTMDYYQHLNVNDLALIVNQQPIVREGLTEQQVLEMLEQTIKRSGITDDKRFNHILNHEGEKLFFEVTVRKV